MAELTYTRVGDYYIPNLTLGDQRTSPLDCMAVCGVPLFRSIGLGCSIAWC